MSVENTHRVNISLNIKTKQTSPNASCLFCFGFQTQDTYKLIIKASDYNGWSGGNTATGEIEIKILDINDNIPTLERDSVGFTHTSHNFCFSSFLNGLVRVL